MSRKAMAVLAKDSQFDRVESNRKKKCKQLYPKRYDILGL
jgi:hypothetical protein